MQHFADGKLPFRFFVGIREMDEQEFIFGRGVANAPGQHTGGRIVAQEDMQFPILLRCAALTQFEPDGILDSARHNEEEQRDGEDDSQDKNSEIRQQQERFPEYDGCNDIVKHNGVADKHLQRRQGRYQEQLDPVAVRYRMGGTGQQHYVHDGTCHEQETEDSQYGTPLTSTEQTTQNGSK